MNILTILPIAVLGCLVTIIAILVLRPLAESLDLVDRPGGRKTHHGNVPLVGGLAMFIGLVIGMGLLPASDGIPVGALGSAFGLLVVTGMMDDRFDLPHWVRLPMHAGVALMLLTLTQCKIESLGNAFAVGDLVMSGAGVYLVTLLLIAAAVNAFNMLDGMDGLAGAVAGVAILALAYVAWRSGATGELGVCAVLFGAIAGFLYFNAPLPGRTRMRCFMGDAGSTLLGVALAWLMVRLSQIPRGHSGGIAPVTALWIAGLPVFELVWSFTRRVARGRSPFIGDAEHFHHILVRAGFSVRGAFTMFLLLTIVLAAIGLSLDWAAVPDYWSLLLLTFSGIVIVRSIYSAGSLLQLLPRVMRRRRRATDALQTGDYL